MRLLNTNNYTQTDHDIEDTEIAMTQDCCHGNSCRGQCFAFMVHSHNSTLQTTQSSQTLWCQHFPFLGGYTNPFLYLSVLLFF